jgi:hypothetical protein
MTTPSTFGVPVSMISAGWSATWSDTADRARCSASSAGGEFVAAGGALLAGGLDGRKSVGDVGSPMQG